MKRVVGKMKCASVLHMRSDIDRAPVKAPLIGAVIDAILGTESVYAKTRFYYSISYDKRNLVVALSHARNENRSSFDGGGMYPGHLVRYDGVSKRVRVSGAAYIPHHDSFIVSEKTLGTAIIKSKMSEDDIFVEMMRLRIDREKRLSKLQDKLRKAMDASVRPDQILQWGYLRLHSVSSARTLLSRAKKYADGDITVYDMILGASDISTAHSATTIGRRVPIVEDLIDRPKNSITEARRVLAGMEPSAIPVEIT